MNTHTSPATSDAPELDILQQVGVTVPCAAGGQHYQVTLREVLLAPEMLHAGCTARDETECLPLTYAGLADEPAVRDFARSRGRLTRQVRATGLDMTISRPVLSH